MDLYLTLSVGIWVVGGLFSSAWLFWLDRDRRELAFPLKAAALIGWPVMLPVLLYERGDLTAWEAGRNALVWLAIVSPGVTIHAMSRFKPVQILETQPGIGFVVDTAPPAPPPPRSSPLPTAPVFSPVSTLVTENDRREAVRYWNSGIIFYQRGDYEKARDEWGRCRQLDSSNSDCATGLSRIEQSYGSVASAPR